MKAYYIGTILFSLFTMLYSLYICKKVQKAEPISHRNGKIPNFSAFDAAIYIENFEMKNIGNIILELAEKNYLKIIYEKNNLKFEKLAQYDGDNIFEKTVFDELFKNTNIIKAEGLSQIQDIKEMAWKIYENVRLKTEVLRNEKISYFFTKIFFIFFIINDILRYLCCNNYIFNENTIQMCFMPIFSCIFLILFIFMLIKGWETTILAKDFKKLPIFLLANLLAWPIILIPILGTICNEGINSLDNIPSIVITTISLFVFVFCGMNISQRTDLGCQLYAESLGLKQFIDNFTIKEVLPFQLEDNDYVFKMLNYSFAFNQYRSWIKITKPYLTNKPNWFNGDYNTQNLINTLDIIAKNFGPIPIHPMFETERIIVDENGNKVLYRKQGGKRSSWRRIGFVK